MTEVVCPVAINRIKEHGHKAVISFKRSIGFDNGQLKLMDNFSAISLLNHYADGGSKADLNEAFVNNPFKTYRRYAVRLHISIDGVIKDIMEQDAVFEGTEPKFLEPSAVFQALIHHADVQSDEDYQEYLDSLKDEGITPGGDEDKMKLFEVQMDVSYKEYEEDA